MFKKYKYKCLSLLILFISVVGCVSTNYTSLIPDTFPPVEKDPEVLFIPPDRPFTIIGLIESNGAAGITHTQLIESIKKEAKKQGANAVYLLSFEELQTQQGIIYNPWLGGYQTFGGFNVPRIYVLALRYKEGNIIETKKMIGQWIGQGVSTLIGNFTLAATINESKGGISGVLTASSGLSGTIKGYIENNSIELLVFPSNLKNYCILKFIGSFDGSDSIKGQYSSVLCNVSEGGVLEISRSKPLGTKDDIEKTKPHDKIGL